MILDKVRATVRRHNLLNKNDKVVIGVSGGPDSLALLFLLNRLKREFKLTLHLAHLDHMLRKESPQDAEFVRELAYKLRLPITTARINIKALAKKGSGEEIARNVRLGFLFKVAKDIKAKKIALGHNLDDQAETVLMRILRGAGLSGLSGILPKRDIAGYQIIRPLIETSRKEIEAFLKRKKIQPRRDASNLTDIYFRNKIRNKLLPLLESQYNRKIKEVLANTAQTVGCDYDYLNKTANRAIKGLRRKLDLKHFLRLHPAIKRLTLRLLIARVKGDLRKITYQHIKEIEDLIAHRPVGSVVDLPKGISVLKTKKYLSFYLR
jgi:tRNA(Ile)-lysidine synthase